MDVACFSVGLYARIVRGTDDYQEPWIGAGIGGVPVELTRVELGHHMELGPVIRLLGLALNQGP